MADSHKEREVSSKGDKANELANNPLLNKVHVEFESSIINQLKALNLTERETEHELVMLLRAGELYQNILTGFISAADIADMNRERQKRVV